MEGHLMAWAVPLAIVIDAVMLAWVCRRIARLVERSHQVRSDYAVSHLSFDDDDYEFDATGIDRYSHGLLTNPTNGLPMLDGVWMDVGGNPYGTGLAINFGSSLDGIGSSSLCAGFGGIHDG